MTQFFTNLSLPPSMYKGPLGGIVPAYADLLCQQGYTTNPPACNFVSSLI